MNFLGHAFLSGNNEKLLLGNFIGDFVKGREYKNFEPEISLGIMLHRFIDSYTDDHPVVSKSKDLFREKYRHYAGVVIDVAYDHFLAKNWHLFHSIDLLPFTQSIYAIMDAHKDILPERFKFVLGYMKRDNWLFHYSKLEGINRALTGMSKRTKFNSHMEHATKDIRANYEVLENDFLTFMPEIQHTVAQWLKNKKG